MFNHVRKSMKLLRIVVFLCMAYSSHSAAMECVKQALGCLWCGNIRTSQPKTNRKTVTRLLIVRPRPSDGLPKNEIIPPKDQEDAQVKFLESLVELGAISTVNGAQQVARKTTQNQEARDKYEISIAKLQGSPKDGDNSPSKSQSPTKSPLITPISQQGQRVYPIGIEEGLLGQEENVKLRMMTEESSKYAESPSKSQFPKTPTSTPISQFGQQIQQTELYVQEQQKRLQESRCSMQAAKQSSLLNTLCRKRMQEQGLGELTIDIALIREAIAKEEEEIARYYNNKYK